MPRRSTSEDFWKHVDIKSSNECWEWTGAKNKLGYGRVRYHQQNWKAHRLAWFLTNGNIDDLHVCHHCDNPSCCNPSHLFLGTAADNMRDCSEKGRHPRNTTHYLPEGDNHHSRLHPEVVARGEKNGAAVLTKEEVIEIRDKRKQGRTLQGLADEYSVAKGTIVFIVTRQTWKHI